MKGNAMLVTQDFGSVGIIDKERALKSLRETIGLNPDFVFNPGNSSECTYVRWSDPDAEGAGYRPIAPSCAVGRALYHEGFTLHTLAAMDDGLAGGIDDAWKDLPVTYGAAQVYGVAQGLQDTGSSNGEALAAAERKAREVTDETPPGVGECDYCGDDCTMSDYPCDEYGAGDA